MPRKGCSYGCSNGSGLPTSVKFTDKTKGVGRTVRTNADLAGARPMMTDKTGCNKTNLSVKNPLNGKK